MMFPAQMANAKFTIPDVTYPGTWFWYYQYSGSNGNPNPYNGTVIILMNQTTQSQAEYACQTFALLPHAIKVGSQTSGVDGDISYYRLGLYIGTGFTTLGTFLPNGDSTQRIGIKPDITMYPTRQGLYQGKDEVLEKALQIAGCPLSVLSINNPKPEITVYPNPSTGLITLNYSLNNSEIVKTTILNELGQVVYGNTEQKNAGNITEQLNLEGLSSGIYSLRMQTDNSIMVSKVVLMGNR